MTKKPRTKPLYYDVERFRRIYAETLGSHTGLRKATGRVTRFLDSIQGIFVAFLAPVIGFGTLLGVVVGSMYGPLVFLAIFGGAIGGLAYVADKKVGGSLQFGNLNLLRSMFAQFVAILIMGGVVLVLVIFRFHLI